MNIIRQIKYDQNWNIGFCEQTSEELILDKQLKPIRWLKHSYRDRWFADPFIYKVTESEIVVFVEECPMENPKGIICELVIDRKSMRLKERFVMLELDTHLSYPAIIRHEGKVYVYPENGASGELNIYEYDENNHRLINPICILKESVADATIIEDDGHFYMSATKYPETQVKAYLYESNSLFTPFHQLNDLPYQTNKRCSRQGGNWFSKEIIHFRPAQDCVKRYGAAISIMEVRLTEVGIEEKEVVHINPIRGRYGLGLHTINFNSDVCVIDGCGYLYPYTGLFVEMIRKLKRRL